MKRCISGTLAAGLLSGMLSLPAGAVSPSTLDPQTAGAYSNVLRQQIQTYSLAQEEKLEYSGISYFGEGLIYAGLTDFNGDQRPELVTLRVEYPVSGSVTAEIWTMSGGKAVRTANCELGIACRGAEYGYLYLMERGNETRLCSYISANVATGIDEAANEVLITTYQHIALLNMDGTVQRYSDSSDQTDHSQWKAWQASGWKQKETLVVGSDYGYIIILYNPATVATVKQLQTALAAQANKAPFVDVSADAYYNVPVRWAVEKKITSGTSATTFSPDTTCSTAQILTFLWRANGSPEPAISNPFTDVPGDAYYTKAAVWAYEKGLVSGSRFGGDTPCTRASAVTYLWKLAGRPAGGSASFTDVSGQAPYAQAVAWAVKEGITSGTSATTFSPDLICSRGQIVTFLYRSAT